MSNNADANDADTPNECKWNNLPFSMASRKLRWAQILAKQVVFVCRHINLFENIFIKYYVAHIWLCVCVCAYCFGEQAKGIISISTCIFLPRMYFCMSVCANDGCKLLVSHFFFSFTRGWLRAQNVSFGKLFVVNTFELITSKLSIKSRNIRANILK